jgi:hypothetical protein
MAQINSVADLKAAIIQLEIKQKEEKQMLKQAFDKAYERMKPINLIRSTISEVSQSQEIKENLINTGIGLATGHISKVLFEGASHSPIRKLLGTVIMFGITNAITKNPEVLKKIGTGLFEIIKSAASKIKAIEAQSSHN